MLPASFMEPLAEVFRIGFGEEFVPQSKALLCKLFRLLVRYFLAPQESECEFGEFAVKHSFLPENIFSEPPNDSGIQLKTPPSTACWRGIAVWVRVGCTRLAPRIALVRDRTCSGTSPEEMDHVL